MVVEFLEGLGVGFLLENRGKFSSTKVSSSIFFFFPFFLVPKKGVWIKGNFKRVFCRVFLVELSSRLAVDT